MQLCNVCSNEVPKYRCPKCLIRYCSLNCFKTHKDTCEPAKQKETLPEQSQPRLAAQGAWAPEEALDEDEETDKVPAEVLKNLGDSEPLKELLRNPHLRQLLVAVDTADDKVDIMKTVMQEPLFVEFADQCLKVVEPGESEED